MAARTPRARAAASTKEPERAAGTLPATLAWMHTFVRPCDERPVAQRPFRLDFEGQPGVVVTNGLIIIATRGESNLEPAPVDHVATLYRHLPAVPGPDRIALAKLRAWLGLPEPPPRCTRCALEHWEAIGAGLRTAACRVGDVAVQRDLLAAAVHHLDAHDVFVTAGERADRIAVGLWAPTWRLALMPTRNVAIDELPAVPLERGSA